MKDKELEIALNHDNIMTLSDYINIRIAYETVYQEKDKEIERLNNIINEFDKWLEEESEKENYSVGHLTCLMMSKVKLQELKDSDKE